MLADAGAALADRERPARAALAGAQPGPASPTSARSGNTPGHLNHWSRRGVHRASSSVGRGGRGAHARSRGRWRSAGRVPRIAGSMRPRSARSGRRDQRATPARRDRLPRDLPGALTMHSLGWAQLAHFAQVRAFADGTGRDRPLPLGDQRQGLDRRPLLLGQVARRGGAVAARLSGDRRRRRLGPRPRRAPRTPARPKYPRWAPRADPPLRELRLRPRRAAIAVEQQIEQRGADHLGADPARRGDPGGPAAARRPLGRRPARARATGPRPRSRSGLATIVMTFASEYFSHVIAAALGFARLPAADARAGGPAAPAAWSPRPG